ncbi:sterol-4-alpha-carboxylate 3-dehydrogenase like protein [Xylariomycetidae sp. FL2044]|nr:sterol-4-alpha-carboxylate 3-dehydrogenase like protein [Xylariomycetidae sp. FL2044]
MSAAEPSYLVTGGCGLQGASIVETLRARHPTRRVTVLSRNPTANRVEGVTYIAGDITSREAVRGALAASGATVVFHVAGTITATRAPIPDDVVRAVNVEGTRLLLEESRRTAGRVRAFVFTSSASVVQRRLVAPVAGADETWPTAREGDPTMLYAITKAEADRLVLAADDPRGMRTASLRPAAIYGERDTDLVPLLMNMAGLGRNGLRTTYVGNSTQAHLLAAEKLLSPPSSADADAVGGQAFFVTNAERYTLWDFARRVWREAGVPLARGDDDARVIPLWLMACVAAAAEWWAWAWGAKPRMTRMTVKMATMTRWYDIAKARDVLGYEPEVSMEEGVKRGVAWYLKQQQKQKEEEEEKEEANAKTK